MVSTRAGEGFLFSFARPPAMPHLAIDFETYYDDVVSVKTLGAMQYARHPQCDPYLVSACDGTSTWVGHPRDFNWDVVTDFSELVAYNAFFDSAIAAYAMPAQHGVRLPADAPPWNCASDLGTFTLQTTSLAATIKKAYDVTLDKAARSSMKGKTWDECKSQERLTEYARRDAWWAWKFYEDHKDRWPAQEQKIARLTREGSRRGIAIDAPKLRAYVAAVREELFNVERLLPWVDALQEKPTGSKAVAAQCRRTGIPVPPVKDDDEEGYELWEAKYAPAHAWIQALGRWRSVNMVRKTLETMLARLREDDTIETPVRYFGAASTGRWSGDGGLNFQNLRKDVIVCAGMEIDVRSLLIPRVGYKLWVADLAQIEPRVLNWLVGNHKMLALIAQGMSPYEAFAREFFGWTGGELKREDPKKYAMMKVMVLGLGYGAGAAKFKGVASTLSGGQVQLTDEESAGAVETFRSNCPLIAGDGQEGRPLGLWKFLDTGFKDAAETDGTFEFELPSGRVLRYENILKTRRTYTEARKTRRLIDGQFVDVMVNHPVSKRVYLVNVNGRMKNVYGGLLTENITQATARDVFCECYLNLCDAGLHVPFTVHDEAVVETPSDVTKAEIEGLMAVNPEWMPGLPVEAEVKEVKHYQK